MEEEYETCQHYGPLFHRWLLDGIKDAIVLNMGGPNAKTWYDLNGAAMPILIT